MDYMIINGFNTSNLKNCYVTDFGTPQRAEARKSESVKIYGANGTLNVFDGAYDGYDRDFTFFVKSQSDALTLIEKFKDRDNELEFSYITDSLFYCDLKTATYEPSGMFNWQVSITVEVHPFRYVKTVDDIVLGSSGTITNPGTVYSEPVIVIEGSGDVTLTIGNQLMQLTLDTKATIDCRHKRQNIYDKAGSLKNTIRKRGPFFELPVGKSGVATSGTVTKITIKGNWRYKV